MPPARWSVPPAGVHQGDPVFSIAALLIGALSVLGYLTIYIVDGIVMGNL